MIYHTDIKITSKFKIHVSMDFHNSEEHIVHQYAISGDRVVLCNCSNVTGTGLAETTAIKRVCRHICHLMQYQLK